MKRPGLKPAPTRRRARGWRSASLSTVKRAGCTWVGLALLAGVVACSEGGDGASTGAGAGGNAGGSAGTAGHGSPGAGSPSPGGAGASDARVPPGPDAAAGDSGKPLPGLDAGMDAGREAGTEVDAAVDGGADAGLDAGEPGEIAATPGARCVLAERIALIEISIDGAAPYLSGTVYEQTNPWYGAPELTTAACAFHRFNAGLCPGACAVDEQCGADGKCVKAPRARRDAKLELRAGTQTQTFMASDLGELYGAVTLAGNAFAATLTFGEHTVSLVETPLARPFADLSGTLTGGYDQPEALDLQWTAPTTGSVYTLIPINHHAGGPTFTECTVPASARALHVDGNMLVPLAVDTGLEFQGLQHAHFAAAETPAGCVELRFTAQARVNLQ